MSLVQNSSVKGQKFGIFFQQGLAAVLFRSEIIQMIRKILIEATISALKYLSRLSDTSEKNYWADAMLGTFNLTRNFFQLNSSKP